MKHLKLYESWMNESVQPHQQEMYDGIVKIVKMVKDSRNRMEIAEYVLKDFEKEKIDVDRKKFLRDCELE